ncbi:MAG: GNAT family N-acetyltransferase [Actinomycetota bacterium]
MEGRPRVRVFTDPDAPEALLAEIHGFLVEAFEGRFSAEDWEHTAGGSRVVVLDGDAPVSHAAVVPRLLRVGPRELAAGYVEGVGTAPGRQGEGLASLAMTEAGKLLPGRFEMGALSTPVPGFYERLGWERWRGPTFVREGTQLKRTPDEDGGIMVLRFGPSRAVDLEAPIACEARSGDDW